MTTGTVESRITPSLFVSAIGVVDGNIVTVGSSGIDRSTSLIISSGTAESLTANWTRSYQRVETGCPGSGDSTYFTADRSVIATGNGMLDFYVRTIDGEPLVDGGLSYTTYQPGVGIVGTRCSSTNSSEVFVYDVSGKLLRRHAPTASSSPKLGIADTAVSPAPYFGEGTLRSFPDGTPVWGAVNPLDDYGLSASAQLIGDTVVVSGSTPTEGYSTAGFSLSDGTKLWGGDSVQIIGQNTWLTDGTRLFSGSSGTLAALDLHTGEQAWSLTYGADNNTATLYRVGDGMLIVTDTELTYVAET
ncbi:PQQ-binding-like beta-propeller repeat protein [Gordonia phthalatica]|uniref:Pyrrolo-quinoline quinone n=1 Tax=Gordonia phthalatica TaxID=1136941 RepID=A0A0N9N9S7_9ACTN|nr:PQQ-binding-like beta-propeller repeat protein [Gordonia phthalatica]ALG84025.1 hypothetical protein ACH46_05260 [Gordonia phthalatica]